MKMPCLLLTLSRSAHCQLASAILISSGLGLFMPGCAFRTGKQPRQEITPLYSASSPEFRQSAGSLLGPDFVSGNDITTLVNGTQIFPAMLSAIRSAKHSINFEDYWFSNGQIGREFTEALAERARAGVKVSAILDALGTYKMGGENLARLREAGVDSQCRFAATFSRQSLPGCRAGRRPTAGHLHGQLAENRRQRAARCRLFSAAFKPK